MNTNIFNVGFVKFWSNRLKSTSQTWQSSPTCPHQCHFFCWLQPHRGRTCPLNGLYTATVEVKENNALETAILFI